MEKRNIIRNQKGFTLIEIITVLVILGILAAVAVPKFMDLQDDARTKSAQAAISETKARLSVGYGKYLLQNDGSEPADVPAICTTVNNVNILPALGVGLVPMGDDYVVNLAANGLITVSVVLTKALDPVVTDTWDMP